MTTRKREDEGTAQEASLEKKTKLADGQELLSGTVTTFHSTRGFGFITPDTAGLQDVFVHQSSIVGVDDGYRFLTVGQKVAYVSEYDEEKKKWKATKVYGPGGAALKTKADPRAKKAAPAKGGKGAKGAKGRKGAEEEAETPAVEPAELLARVTTQLEYYLSDKNLTRDQWMRNMINASGKGAVSVDDLLKCNKLKAHTQGRPGVRGYGRV